jgi:7-cyano-7-deazaguanine synthase|tara:strand:- start:4347 stop:5042 length:696 start_codon:yes stop_codon:yes gene_type:complete
MKKNDGIILCVISGGMDSATMLYKAQQSSMVREGKFHVEAISFNYGQRHSKELSYAAMLCEKLKVRHDIIDISTLKPHIGGSALTDDIDVPEGHYASESMALTVVPNRNAIMLSIAVGIAVARKAEFVGAAMHAGDHAVYPDCRPKFVKAFQRMTDVATEGFADLLHIWAPFIHCSKTDIAKEGETLDVDYSLTWSCYKGEENHCGVCGTCVERKEAFRDSGVPDPTVYAY